MRQVPQREPAPVQVAMPGICDTRTYRFLTPVFGGGVEVQDHRKPVDSVTPIRVASVRGQLRFWWRACNPRKLTTIDELRSQETMVFGSTEQASPLSIMVSEQPAPPRDVKVFKDGDKYKLEPKYRDLAYGAFPLRDAGNDGHLHHGVLHEYSSAWSLEFAYPQEIKQDVEAALWGWGHFGGLGGRTRRGFGAIAQTDPPLSSIEDGWTRFVGELEVSWPHLRDRNQWLRTAAPRENGVDAQQFLLYKLSALRQTPAGRKPTPEDDNSHERHPGRSYWPEPDEIRRLTHRAAEKHKKSVTTVHKFPRATFGLPIIYHFKDDKHKPVEPPESHLVPVGFDRLASPLILRPHQRPNGSIEPLALVLGHPTPPDGYELKCDGGGSFPVHTELTKAEAKSLGPSESKSPMVAENGSVFTDPLRRYLEEIR